MAVMISKGDFADSVYSTLKSGRALWFDTNMRDERFKYQIDGLNFAGACDKSIIESTSEYRRGRMARVV